MSYEHTPGPWEVVSYGAPKVYEIEGERRNVAHGIWFEGDARLIAAAPDLLAACEGMLKHIDDVLDDEDLMSRRAAIVDAIRKATG